METSYISKVADTSDTSKVAKTSYTSMVADALSEATLWGIHGVLSVSIKKEVAFTNSFGNRLKICLGNLNKDHADLKANMVSLNPCFGAFEDSAPKFVSLWGKTYSSRHQEPTLYSNG